MQFFFSNSLSLSLDLSSSRIFFSLQNKSTHHHWDHTGGNLQLKENSQVKIYGPANENIPGRDVALNGGDEFTSFGGGDMPVQIIDVGGHTNGHIAYYFPKDGLVFCGDALFALGCGKMFEGTPSQFWDSLKRLRALPDETVGASYKMFFPFFSFFKYEK